MQNVYDILWYYNTAPVASAVDRVRRYNTAALASAAALSLRRRDILSVSPWLETKSTLGLHQ